MLGARRLPAQPQGSLLPDNWESCSAAWTRGGRSRSQEGLSWTFVSLALVYPALTPFTFGSKRKRGTEQCPAWVRPESSPCRACSSLAFFLCEIREGTGTESEWWAWGGGGSFK